MKTSSCLLKSIPFLALIALAACGGGSGSPANSTGPGIRAAWEKGPPKFEAAVQFGPDLPVLPGLLNSNFALKSRNGVLYFGYHRATASHPQSEYYIYSLRKDQWLLERKIDLTNGVIFNFEVDRQGGLYWAQFAGNTIQIFTTVTGDKIAPATEPLTLDYASPAGDTVDLQSDEQGNLYLGYFEGRRARPYRLFTKVGNRLQELSNAGLAIGLDFFPTNSQSRGLVLDQGHLYVFGSDTQNKSTAVVKEYLPGTQTWKTVFTRTFAGKGFVYFVSFDSKDGRQTVAASLDTTQPGPERHFVGFYSRASTSAEWFTESEDQVKEDNPLSLNQVQVMKDASAAVLTVWKSGTPFYFAIRYAGGEVEYANRLAGGASTGRSHTIAVHEGRILISHWNGQKHSQTLSILGTL